MKLVTYRHDAHGPDWRAGVLQGDRILDAARLLSRTATISVLEIISGSSQSLPDLSSAATTFAKEHESSVFVPRETAVPAWEASLRCPLPDPP